MPRVGRLRAASARSGRRRLPGGSRWQTTPVGRRLRAGGAGAAGVRCAGGGGAGAGVVRCVGGGGAWAMRVSRQGGWRRACASRRLGAVLGQACIRRRLARRSLGRARVSAVGCGAGCGSAAGLSTVAAVDPAATVRDRCSRAPAARRPPGRARSRPAVRGSDDVRSTAESGSISLGGCCRLRGGIAFRLQRSAFAHFPSRRMESAQRVRRLPPASRSLARACFGEETSPAAALAKMADRRDSGLADQSDPRSTDCHPRKALQSVERLDRTEGPMPLQASSDMGRLFGARLVRQFVGRVAGFTGAAGRCFRSRSG